MLKKTCFITAVVAIIFLTASGKAYAGHIGGSIYYLEDKSGAMRFETASSKELESKYTYMGEDFTPFGSNPSAFWFRLKLPKGTSDSYNKDVIGRTLILELGYPNLENIDVYVPVANKHAYVAFSSTTPYAAYVHYSGGTERPAKNLKYMLNNWVYTIPENAVAGGYCYIRAQCKVVVMNMGARLLELDDYRADEARSELIYGLFFGILLAMMIYNIFVYVALKDRTYLYYVFYITSMLIYQLLVQGHVFMFLKLSGSLYAKCLLGVIGIVSVFALLFSQRLLEVKATLPRLHSILMAFVCLSTLQCISAFTGFLVLSNALSAAMAVIIPIYIIILGVIRLRQGYRMAVYYLSAFGLMAVGTVIWVLAGRIPLPFNFRYLYMFTVSGESLLLSLALGYRVKLMRTNQDRLGRSVQHYRNISARDSLTGLYNRRYLHETLHTDFMQAVEKDTPLSVIMADVDDFKAYNDSYGHLEGDNLLIGLAKVMTDIAVGNMTPFRFGGEEFTMILPNTGSGDAIKTADRIRLAFMDIQTGHRRPLCTISLGVAEMVEEDTPESLLQRADEALYLAKTEGKNKVAWKS